MSTPASKELIDRLAENMGNIIQDCFPILEECIATLTTINQKIFSEESGRSNYNDYKNILELHASVLYVIIEVSSIFRADFHSDITIERKINLKYIVFITSEFFKATFDSKNKSLWDKVFTYLSSLNIDAINNGIANINENIFHYKKSYYDKDKGHRDIAVHYDFELDKLYNYIVNISEEEEAKRLCNFLAIVQPLNKLLIIYSSIIRLQFQTEYSLAPFNTIFEENLYNTLKKTLYSTIGDSLQHFAECLDKDMHTYAIPDKIPQNIKSILDNSGINKIKKTRDFFKLGILLHYIYLDLGTAIRGALQSESDIERRWHIIRLNLIIYEGWKKIYLADELHKQRPLWEEYIYNPLSISKNDSIKEELNSVDSLLSLYKGKEDIKDIRHQYIHLRERKEFNLLDLFDELLKLNSYSELNKALDFLKLLPRIIKLNKEAMNIVSEIERSNTIRKMQEPFNKIRSKISKSNTSEDKKIELLKIIEDGENKIMKHF